MKTIKCNHECKYLGCKFNSKFDKQDKVYSFLPVEKEEVNTCNCYLDIEEKPLFKKKGRY